MIPLRLFVFDDRRARRWAPFTLTRPAGELMHGCFTLRERVERVMGVRCEAHVSRRALLGLDEADAPPTVSLDSIGTGGARVFVSSRAVLDLEELELDPQREQTLSVDGKIAGWVLPDGAPLPSELWIRDPDAAPARGTPIKLGGTLLGRPWDLVLRNPERIRHDVETLWPEDRWEAGPIRVGKGVLSVAEGAEVEPGVHLDTRRGPIRLAEGVRVQGPARLTGPLYIGRDGQILGGHVAASTFGPVCIVRGEVADSVFLGFANKAHDGYLGHSLVGRWVNLGAFTTNSDLKNNYHSVRVWTPDGDVDTGQLKVGCFLGDHVKAGIGTLINTGTVIGAGSNVFGGLMPPSVVPPFSWGSGPDLRDHLCDKFLATAEAAMARRGQPLTPGVRHILEEAWRATAGRRAEGS